MPARAAADGWLAQGQQLARRHALVVGNGAYQEGPLANPVNDAADMTRALRELGFEVTVLNNSDKRALLTALRQFNERLRQGEMGLFFYAGHGVQVAGENYLIPVDAQLALQADVEIDAIDLRKVLNAMDSSNAAVKIVILDACRDNPFYRRWRSSGRAMPSRGLAETRQTGSGTIIAFATAPGQTAADGQPGSRNSPYTAALLKHLRTPGLNIQMMFNYVRSDVSRTTQGKQMPWEQGALLGDVVLRRPITLRESSPSTAETFLFMKSGVASGGAARADHARLPEAAGYLDLIKQYHEADSLCRGGDGSAMRECQKREYVSIELAKRGYCFGRGMQSNSEFKWHICQVGSWGHAKSLYIQRHGPIFLGHFTDISSVGYSPDGHRIVSGSGDYTLRLWDAASGRQIGPPLQGHTESVNSVAWSPDGRRIVSGSNDKTLRLWDGASGRQIGPPLQQHTSMVYSVAWSPDGRRIVSASEDKTLRLWDGASGKPIGPPLQGHTEGVRTVAWSPDGRRIVSGSNDMTLRLWDGASGRQIGPPLQGHTEGVRTVAWSPDGRRIVSASEDKTLRLWDGASGQPISP